MNPSDIYNVDETALFCMLTPDRTLAFKSEEVYGAKRSKERVSALLGVSMAGEKLPPLIIGKLQKPRCFRGIRHVPLKYKANRRAWMTSATFEEWIRNFDRSLRRIVILLVDSCTAHPKLEG